MPFVFEEFLIRLKERKKEKNLKVGDISELSNVPIGTVSKIFAGITTDPKISTVIAIADALDVSVDYLIYGKEDLHSEKVTKLPIVEKYMQLEYEDQKEIDAIVDYKIERLSKKMQSNEETA